LDLAVPLGHIEARAIDIMDNSLSRCHNGLEAQPPSSSRAR
jgi:hypothetical protein